MIRIILFRLPLFFSLLFIRENLHAQNYGCYDSLLIAPGAYCPPAYEPVCACNGKTYRNSCFANIEGYQQFQSGICEAIDININMNPVYSSLVVDVVLKTQGDASLYIFDIFGKTYYTKSYTAIEKASEPINTESYPRGVYLVVARNGDNQIVRKFLKIEL